MSAPQVRVSADAAELAERVAAVLIGRLAELQRAAAAAPHVCLTGGTIADAVHRAVAASPDRGLVDWARVEFWWGDERYVPAGHADRNAGQARAAFLDTVGVDPARVHEMPAADGGHPSLDAAATSYAEELAAHGPAELDLVMLGVGPDGHVASLFPGHRALDVAGAATVAVPDSPKPPPARISLTLPMLNRAREVWFLASGSGKREAVGRALAGADVHEIPAAGVHGRERTVWYLDQPAAPNPDSSA